MTRADHTPSRSCYQRGCPRPECKQADYQYMSRLRLDHERGQRRRCDATQTRHHIERLHAAGWTQAQIARAAGLAHRTVGAITIGASTISRHTALAILSIPVGPAPADQRDIDATGTVRRLQALAAIGWPIAQLAPRIGIYETACGNIARGELRQVRAATAEAVAGVYRELSRIPGPSNRIRTQAAKKGWHSPAAWDDIDNPNAQPETQQVIDLDLKRDELAAVRRAEIEHLASFNLSTTEIASRLGLSISTVNAIVRELHGHQRRDRKQAVA